MYRKQTDKQIYRDKYTWIYTEYRQINRYTGIYTEYRQINRYTGIGIQGFIQNTDR